MPIVARRLVLVSPLLMLSLLISRPAAAQTRPGSCAEIPPNLQVDALLQPVVRAMLRASETFRRQWATIAAAPAVQVRIDKRQRHELPSVVRAQATIGRYAHGAVRAAIGVPIGADYSELLAHELEHVLEQMEGIDLPALVRTGEARVVHRASGAYETRRAVLAGRQAAQELNTRPGPALDGRARRTGSFLRALGARAATPAARAAAAKAAARR